MGLAEAQQKSQPVIAEPREAYRSIRNYLAGRLVGATRDETLVEELIKLIFCRALLNEGGISSSPEGGELADRYREAFAALQLRMPGLFDRLSETLLDPASIGYIDAQLTSVDFENPTRDPIGDAYEAFIGSAVRGAQGQFFTPQNAVRLLVDLIDPQPGERIIDPACGAGGFLSHAARHLRAKGVGMERIAEQIHGIDKDRYLTSLAAAHVCLVTLRPARVYCADSLAWAPGDGGAFPLRDDLGAFDVVITNPPFGNRIVAASKEAQRGFDLGFKWKRTRDHGWVRTHKLQPSVSPQILFIERCLSMVRPGGRIGIVVPESLVSGKSYRYVVQYIRDRADVQAVVGMPEELFKTSGKGGTHTKTCVLLLRVRRDRRRRAPRIFMAEARWCGHDSRGRAIDRDDLPSISARYGAFRRRRLNEQSHLGFSLAASQLKDHVLAPRYYDPEIAAELSKLSEARDLVTIRQLVDAGVLQISTGHEVGKMAYGGGPIPFVRTSDISNWEVKVDPKHTVSDEVYAALSPKQDVREGDILMVRDGTYLIGTCAYITKYDTRIVFQSHLYKLRILKPDELSPFLLLAALSSPPVRRQVKAKRFTQDIIDSLGDRLYELVLPLPKGPEERDRIAGLVARAIRERVEARELARRACLEVAGEAVGPGADLEIL